jgi:hypothetical protein
MGASVCHLSRGSKERSDIVYQQLGFRDCDFNGLWLQRQRTPTLLS